MFLIFYYIAPVSHVKIKYYLRVYAMIDTAIHALVNVCNVLGAKNKRPQPAIMSYLDETGHAMLHVTMVAILAINSNSQVSISNFESPFCIDAYHQVFVQID